MNRQRNRTLIITEGNHEKNKLIKIILLAFPEIKIPEDNIIIYESNIYNLYNKIIREYGQDWQEQDVDLPKCVAKWKNMGVKLEKIDFTNVILIFDYERQDPNFSEATICEMQKYFSDINDVGQLYINYPMVESYLDIDLKNSDDYEFRTFSADFSKGNEYKAIVKGNQVCNDVFLFHKLANRLEEIIHDKAIAENTAKNILIKFGMTDSQNEFYKIFSSVLAEKDAVSFSHQYFSILKNMGYDMQAKSYFSYIRDVFMIITESNIRKALMIQGDDYHIDSEQLDDYYYEKMNLSEILKKQNKESRNKQTGFIWVLNTSMYIISNYKFFWREFNSSL